MSYDKELVKEQLELEDVYNYVKNKLLTQSTFTPHVMRVEPTKGNKFPLVIIPVGRVVLNEETLKTKGDEKAYTITYDIEIFAMDTTINGVQYSRMTIVNTLLRELQDIFEEDLGMLGSLPFVRENADVNVARILVDFTCKYKNDIIYRR